MIPPFQNALVLTGPTGSGKTALGVELAERLGAEIVSMDSMALYRGMDIGTAKPGPEERRRVPHHLLDVLDPWESANVAWWLERAADCCRDIEGRGKKVLFVGGTPLYLKAMLFGLFDGPPADVDLRRRLSEQAEREGSQVLHDRLSAVDVAAAARLHPNDVRRVIRALEVWELTGRSISEWQTQWKISDLRSQISDLKPELSGRERSDFRSRISDLRSEISNLKWKILWLDLPREELYARIDERVTRMIEEGLVEEVHVLRRLPRSLGREASQALGYKEMFDHLDGLATLEETAARIRQRSRNFAKRQITWFRHLPECRAVTTELTIALWGLTMN